MNETEQKDRRVFSEPIKELATSLIHRKKVFNAHWSAVRIEPKYLLINTLYSEVESFIYFKRGKSAVYIEMVSPVVAI